MSDDLFGWAKERDGKDQCAPYTGPRPHPRLVPLKWRDLNPDVKKGLLILYRELSAHSGLTGRELIADMAHVRRMHMHGIYEVAAYRTGEVEWRFAWEN